MSAPLDAAGWRQRGLRLAWFTVAYNLLEGAVSIGLGVSEDSVALWGFGFDSLVEVASALVVLWRLGGDLAARAEARERRATLAIGALFVLLAAGIVAGAGLQLRAGQHPASTLPGTVIALLSLSFMVWLWRSKLAVARALESPALAGDAACSLACIQLSAVLLAGSAAFALFPRLWWADAVAGLGLAGLILREGVGMIRAARRPDFQGGCGCGHGACGTGTLAP